MPDTLPTLLRDLVSGSIDVRGVHPQQAAVVHMNHAVNYDTIPGDEKLVARWIRSMLAFGVLEIIFATDRFALAGQGTELEDLVAGAHLRVGVWRPFIIEYRHDPRLVKPICWTNGYWNRAIAEELAWMLPPGSRVEGVRS